MLMAGNELYAILFGALFGVQFNRCLRLQEKHQKIGKILLYTSAVLLCNLLYCLNPDSNWLLYLAVSFVTPFIAGTTVDWWKRSTLRVANSGNESRLTRVVLRDPAVPN